MPKAYRRGTNLPRITLSLSAEDRTFLDKIKAAYLKTMGLNLSSSIIVAVALADLYERVQRGDVRLQGQQ